MNRKLKLSFEYCKENEDFYNTDGVDVAETYREGYEQATQDIFNWLKENNDTWDYGCEGGIEPTFYIDKIEKYLNE